jgi:hypothetical protein
VDHIAVPTQAKSLTSGYTLTAEERIQREEYYVYLVIANAMKQGRRLFDHKCASSPSSCPPPPPSNVPAGRSHMQQQHRSRCDRR